MKFEEQYWDEAFAVLRREEKKAWRRKWLPFMYVVAGAFTVVVFGLILSISQNGMVIAPNSHAIEIKASTPNQELAVPNEQEAPSIQPAPGNDNFDNHTAFAQLSQSTQHNESAEKQKKTKWETTSLTSNSVESDSEESAVKADVYRADEKTNADVYSNYASNHDLEDLSENPANLAVDLRVSSSLIANIDVNDVRQPEFRLMEPRRIFPSGKVTAVLHYGNHDYNRVFPVKGDHFFISGGQSFLAGYGSRKGEIFFNPEITVGFEKAKTQHFSMNGRLAYFNISGISHVAEFDQTELGFGFTTTRTSIRTNRLHFASLPVQLNYDFSRRNSLVVGARATYLINSLSLVTVSEIDNFSETEVDRFEEWGYVGGYKPLNFALHTGYEFRITPEWTFTLHYQYGLKEITRENIYGTQSKDRNSRLITSLKYELGR